MTTGATAPGRSEVKGFLGTLFDFGFTSFITLKFLKVIYAVVMAFIVLFALIVIGTAASRGAGGAVFAFIIVPIGAFVYLVLVRISLELVALLFRIGENTSLIARSLRAGAGPAGWQPGPPTPETGYGYAPQPDAGTDPGSPYGYGYGGGYAGPPQ